MKFKRTPLLLINIIVILAVFFSFFKPTSDVSAEPPLTVFPISWNVVGLDSNNVLVGPNQFPIGARVCNTTLSPITNLTSTFAWTTTDPYIALRSGTNSSYTNGVTLAAGACKDYFYEVEIVRNSLAYNHTRRYVISFNADGSLTASTPIPREIFVEHLVSQNRNSVTDVKLDGASIPNGGTLSLAVGNTYDIQLIGNTSTNGYNQLESFINLPNTIFRINSVSSTYTVSDIGSPIDKLYADGCGWNNNPLTTTYRSCIISDGKAGGGVTTTFNVTILSGGGTSLPLNTMLYDFSGSSYHYNSDYTTSGRIIAVVAPVTLSKSFSPVSITTSGTSTLTFSIHNTSSTAAVSGISLVDVLPLGAAQMKVAATTSATSNCGSAVLTAVLDTDTISISNVSIVANGTCTYSVPVKATANGSYINTSQHLFANGIDSGLTATANLTVADQSSGTGCVSGTLASWTFPAGTNATTPASTTPSGASTLYGGLGAGLPLGIFVSNTDRLGGVTGSWGANGNVNNSTAVLNTADNEYIEFTLPTTNISSLSLRYYTYRKAQGPVNWALYHLPEGGSLPGSPTATGTLPAGTTWYDSTSINISSGLNANGNNKFRIYLYNAQSSNSGNGDFYLDDVTFTGCALSKPTITKSFSPNPIIVGAKSTLTFTLQNQNSYDLTQVGFLDSFPTGVTVSNPVTTAVTCPAGSLGTVAVGDNQITFSSGTITANTSCTVSVQVTASSIGAKNNVSGYITSAQSGANTGSSGYATATLNVYAPATFAKKFSPNPIISGGISTLTFTIFNPNSNTLGGVTFSDTLPGDLLITNPNGLVNTNCNTGSTPTITASAGTNLISVSNAGIAAGATCSIAVGVTSNTPGDYANTTSTLTTSVTGLTSPAASDTLAVITNHPGIKLIKQISTSPSGPWTNYTTVTPGTSVYYRLTVENIGDVDLTGVTVVDAAVDLSSCIWNTPISLTIADPIKSCIIGPITSIAGEHVNKATAVGSYNSTVYTSSSTAEYLGAVFAETPELTLQKQVGLSPAGPWVKSLTGVSEGTELYYKFSILNSGNTSLSGIALTDNTLDVSSCSYIDPLDTGQTTVCIVGPVLALTGTNQNIASAHDDTTVVSNNSTATYTTGSYGISGKIWEDQNADGIIDVGESGLFNFTVALYRDNNLDGVVDGGDTFLGNQSSSFDGTYSFGSLPDGAYLLETDPIVGLYSLVSGTNPRAVTIDHADSTGNNFGYNTAATATPTPTSGTPTDTPTSTPETPTDTSTPTPVPPTDTPTSTPETPTNTYTPTPVPPTDTPTVTPVTPTDTSTPTPIPPTDTSTPTVVAPTDTSTPTPIPPTDTPTSTPVPPTDTSTPTPIPPTDTPTATPVTPTDTSTPTPIPPTDTPTSTPVPPTDTSTPTPIPPTDTPTPTPVPPTDTSTPTPVPPTDTFTPTAVPPTDTSTPTPVPPTDTSTPTLVPPTPTATSTSLPGNVSIIKNFVDSSESSTTLPNVTIGEMVTYQIVITIPVGVRNNTLVIDHLDTGLAFVDCEGIVAGQGLSSSEVDLTSSNNCTPGTTAGSNPMISDNGGTVTFDFGTLINSGNTSETITIRYRSVVLDTTANTNGDQLNNLVNMTWDGGSGSDSSPQIRLVEPKLTIDKTVNHTAALPGGMVTYSLRIRHTSASSATAFDVVIADQLPLLLTLSGIPRLESGQPWTSWNYDPFTRTLTFRWDTFEDGATTVVSFDTILGDLNKGDSVSNTGSVEWTTLPGDVSTPQSIFNADSTERWYDPGDPADVYYAEDTISIGLPLKLPETGFKPNVVQSIPDQPLEKSYLDMNDLWLEIPRIKVSIPITGVPIFTDGWDLTWLNNQAGWLEDTAYPTHSGNSVLTSHVVLADGNPGPFNKLGLLSWGDLIIVHMGDQKYIFSVRSRTRVAPDDLEIISHEDYPWLTLMTCGAYDSTNEIYQKRVVIKAVLVKIE